VDKIVDKSYPQVIHRVIHRKNIIKSITYISYPHYSQIRLSTGFENNFACEYCEFW
jgi:hypothetical protein